MAKEMTMRRAFIELTAIGVGLFLLGLGLGLWLGYWLGKQSAPIEKPASAKMLTLFAQTERTIWVMAVYRDGDLVKTAEFASEGQCRAQCEVERLTPRTTCLCGPRRIYRPKGRMS